MWSGAVAAGVSKCRENFQSWTLRTIAWNREKIRTMAKMKRLKTDNETEPAQVQKQDTKPDDTIAKRPRKRRNAASEATPVVSEQERKQEHENVVSDDEDAVDRKLRARRRAYALSPLKPIPKTPERHELDRIMSERSRFEAMMRPNTVTLWLYQSETLVGLLYAILFMYTDYSEECFPAINNQFSVYDDAELLNRKFDKEGFSIPEERLCVILLGTAGRNAYKTEVINEVVRHRISRVDRSRTIFLYKGTRSMFREYLGAVDVCTLDRDDYVIDWNDSASLETNTYRHVSEDVFSQTVQKPRQDEFVPYQKGRISSASSSRGSLGEIVHHDTSKTRQKSSYTRSASSAKKKRVIERDDMEIQESPFIDPCDM